MYRLRVLITWVVLSIFLTACVKKELGEQSQILSYYNELSSNIDDKESFVFFTDPHISLEDSVFEYYINTLYNFYLLSSSQFCVCGGDWLRNSDTKEEAIDKFNGIDSLLYDVFKFSYFPVLGNHDTNYQGITIDGSNDSAILPYYQICESLFNRFGQTYYSFNTKRTRYFVFDTGIEWLSTIDEFRIQQIEWFYKLLLNNQKEHIVVFLHIYKTGTCQVHPFSKIMMDISLAFNAKTTMPYNDGIWDFTNTRGRVSCFICGHMHEDYIDETTSIPVIGTTHLRAGDVPTFDMCLIDWDSNIMDLIRVGTGCCRKIKLS